MKDVKAHICPTCGGQLLVNTERQMYECPFCGVTFDYDYFREESVLGIAAQALKSNEFDSADRAYGFLLEKEPDNFEALRGKALIAMNIPKIDDIRSLDLFSKINYESVCKEIGRAIGSSKPQDREYFTGMEDIVKAGKEYIDENAQLETQKNERKRLQSRLNEFARERDTIFIYSSTKIRAKTAVILTVLCYFLCLLLVFLGYKYANRNPYSKAEDLSIYETTGTTISDVKLYYPEYNDFNEAFDAYSDHVKQSQALEREEQRKINYEEWEKNHSQYATTNLIGVLSIATFFYALVVFILFICGRNLVKEITKMQAKVDEQDNRIENRKMKIAELKSRIDQGYNRLCELHPISESE